MLKFSAFGQKTLDLHPADHFSGVHELTFAFSFRTVVCAKAMPGKAAGLRSARHTGWGN